MSRVLMWLIRKYQGVSHSLLPRACRFSPSCSQYAIEAIKKYGAVRGVGLALWRLVRCSPFGPGGYDPVR